MAAPPIRRIAETRKVAQLTGEFDRQGWDGIGAPPFAPNRTESRHRIRGTDLGVSFEHKGRAYFLFGDTWRAPRKPDTPYPDPAERDLDAIAFTSDRDARNGIDLTFLPAPPRIHGPTPIPQGGFEVPLDGTSVGGAMYVFFSTDHFRDGQTDLMGRSILARSDNDGLDFGYLYDLSRYDLRSAGKFINVSVERTVLNVADATLVGLRPRTEVLWLWGTGRYRASDVYLAVLPLAGLGTMQGLRYFAGSRGAVAWSQAEADATPIVLTRDAGEISVRWNPFLNRYLLLYNSGQPRGILLHSAHKPWGPWSAAPVLAFDPWHADNPNDPNSLAGYGRFMHWPPDATHDHVHDDMFVLNRRRGDEWGGEYGPYQIARYTTGARGQWARIYFTMSTWNPYQVMLMTTVVRQALV